MKKTIYLIILQNERTLNANNFIKQIVQLDLRNMTFEMFEEIMVSAANSVEKLQFSVKPTEVMNAENFVKMVENHCCIE